MTVALVLVVPFDDLLDRFLDILETFNSGVKHTLSTWLTIDSHIAGRCHKNLIIL